MMAQRAQIEIGDPVVVHGQKYRIRQIIRPNYFLVSRAPKRNPTHSLTSDSPLIWDARARVFRVQGHTLLVSIPAINPRVRRAIRAMR